MYFEKPEGSGRNLLVVKNARLYSHDFSGERSKFGSRSICIDIPEEIKDRLLEDGYMEVEEETPRLITCVKELNTPRYMTVRGIIDCFEKPIEVYDYETLKDEPLIDPTTIGLKGSPTNIFRSFTPPQKGQVEMISGSAKEAAGTLAAKLAKRHVI